MVKLHALSSSATDTILTDIRPFLCKVYRNGITIVFTDTNISSGHRNQSFERSIRFSKDVRRDVKKFLKEIETRYNMKLNIIYFDYIDIADSYIADSLD